MEGVVPPPSVGLLSQPKRKLMESGFEGPDAALPLSSTELDELQAAGVTAADSADPELKRRKTDAVLPMPPLAQDANRASQDTGNAASSVVSPTPGVAGGASTSAPASPGAKGGFAAAASAAIAAAAAAAAASASSANPPPVASIPPTSSLHAPVSSSGTAAADQFNEEEVDEEYDPTASQYVPGEKSQTTEGAGVRVATPPISSPTEGVSGPPAVAGQGAPQAMGGMTVAGSGSTAALVSGASATPVGAASRKVATANAAGTDAAQGVGDGMNSGTPLQPGLPAPPGAVPSSGPQPPSDVAPTSMDVPTSHSPPSGSASASEEADTQVDAIAPQPLATAGVEMNAPRADALGPEQPTSPPSDSMSDPKASTDVATTDSDEDDDGEPQKFVIPLPEPTLPSALKSRPPVTSLLPPTSASRTATQGPRKRVQWAAEVSKVALIENREELAELWDTGPDAAEMPVALLTPPPAPQGGDTMSAFEMAKKKERDSEQERMRAAKAALWTRLDRMAADIPYQTPPRLVLIPAGCETYNPGTVESPHRDEVERQRKQSLVVEVFPDVRRFRSPPSPPLHSYTGTDDDAEVPVIPLDDITSVPAEATAQPPAAAVAPLSGAPTALAAAVAVPPGSGPVAPPAAVPSPHEPPHPASGEEHNPQGGSATVHAVDTEGVRNGAGGTTLPAGHAQPMGGPAVVGSGDGVGGAPAAAGGVADGANRVSSLLGGLDLSKLQQLLGATNNLINQQQRKPEPAPPPFAPGAGGPLCNRRQQANHPAAASDARRSPNGLRSGTRRSTNSPRARAVCRTPPCGWGSPWVGWWCRQKPSSSVECLAAAAYCSIGGGGGWRWAPRATATASTAAPAAATRSTHASQRGPARPLGSRRWAHAAAPDGTRAGATAWDAEHAAPRDGPPGHATTAARYGWARACNGRARHGGHAPAPRYGSWPRWPPRDAAAATWDAAPWRGLPPWAAAATAGGALSSRAGWGWQPAGRAAAARHAARCV
eukprot:TRINITY_DN3736_c0_g1_i11.p1 TRINITY_DN3736_c0_g1~~TRINITY_DN3736_c0_g1_i11.p1  ORF type:complete len:998 (-),score=70.10 TRINITY_DN3736_c0_g1_i11:381-3374(-)